MLRRLKSAAALACAALLFFSCKTLQGALEGQAEAVEGAEAAESRAPLSTLFAGDIMAHKVNWSAGGYGEIWKDVAPLALSCDISFANIETPVCAALPYSTYPQFNVHPDYADAAIQAGFCAISLANNHSNDWFLEGIEGTLAWSEERREETAGGARPVVFSGLKESDGAPMSFALVSRGEWKILFLAVTELLNRNDSKARINFTSSANDAREKFISEARALRDENPCDIFALSIHTDETEYVHEISSERRAFYLSLLDEGGVDVVWANHPHVARKVELLGSKGESHFTKLIMYSNGNTVSGQRTRPRFSNPSNPRDDTGDGLMVKAVWEKDSASGRPFISSCERFFITTYIDTQNRFVVKFLDDDFVEYLGSLPRDDWAGYISERKKIMEQTKVDETWR